VGQRWGKLMVWCGLGRGAITRYNHSDDCGKSLEKPAAKLVAVKGCGCQVTFVRATRTSGKNQHRLRESKQNSKINRHYLSEFLRVVIVVKLRFLRGYPSLMPSFEGNLLTQRHQITSLETRDRTVKTRSLYLTWA